MVESTAVRQVLYDTPMVQLVRRNANPSNGRLVVTFTPAIEDPKLVNKLGFGETFLSSRGYDVLCFISNTNHWWSVPEMEPALKLAEKVCEEYKSISSYGISMGAYASLAFSRRLNISSIIAVVPQYTVDPSKPPYDVRWAHFFAKLPMPIYNLNAGLNKDATVTFIYDPFSHDLDHIKLVETNNARHLYVSFIGHGATPYLTRLGLLKSVILETLSGVSDMSAQMRAIRRSRRTDKIFKLSLARYCAEHGHKAIADKLAEQTKERDSPKIVKRYLTIYRLTRNFFGLGSTYSILLSINSVDVESREKSIDYFAKFLRSEKDLTRSRVVKILRHAQGELQSSDLERLARLKLRKIERQAAT